MTAVASPPSFQPLPRLGWNSGNTTQGGLTSMSADDVTRLFMPRKAPERSNSSSSISSVASTASLASTSTLNSNNSHGTAASRKAELNAQSERETLAQRKKPARGLWPSSKAESVSGISNARPQTLPVPSSGASAAAVMSAIHQPGPILPSNASQSMQQMNGIRPGMAQGGSESAAILALLPMNGTFERKQISVPAFPEFLRVGRQTNAKTVPTPQNGYFDSKVLSRQHAEVWADRNGKIWIRDVKSSNGTFVNGVRLSAENRDSEPHELREHDMLELGIDIISEDQKSILHHKVSAKVEHAGLHHSNNTNVLDMNFGDIDPGSGGGLMGPPFPPHVAQLRGGRNGSQGSMINSGRMSNQGDMGVVNMNGFGAQRQMNAWLNPITIEQVVKRLTVEFKQAKQQSQDLQRSTEFFNALLAHEARQEPPKPPADILPLVSLANGTTSSAKLDHISPFLQPPAPPPQQPLPEKPDVARPTTVDSNVQTSPKRIDNNRTRSPIVTSPTKQDATTSQILSLVEALTTAKREIDSQGDRVKQLEDLLKQERQARESAEERARRLLDQSRALGFEQKGNIEEDTSDPPSKTLPSSDQSHANNYETSNEEEHTGGRSPNPNSTPSSPKTFSREDTLVGTLDVDSPLSRLQSKIDILMREIDETKLEMEKYRRRAEDAEEARDSLAQMVERIRKGGTQAKGAEDIVSRRQSSEISTQTDTGSLANGHREPSDKHQGNTGLKTSLIPNGKPVPSMKDAKDLQEAVAAALAQRDYRNERLMQSAPYASMLGVVLIGVGIMTYLNGWQKVDL